VSDSKKFGTRDPAHTGGPELPEVGPPPPGSASTFYVSGSVFEYLRWLEEIPWPVAGCCLTERALDTSQGCVAELGRTPAGRRATGWRPSRCGGVRNVRTSTSGHTRTRLSARVPRQRRIRQAAARRGWRRRAPRPANGLLEEADESCWFFSRTSAASSFRTGCPCARARRTRTTNEGEPTAIVL
jgi:hypothetical protein